MAVYTRHPIAPAVNYKTLKGLLLNTAADHPSRGHYFYGKGIDETYTFLSYEALVRRSEQLARQLVAAKLVPGTIALLYLESLEQYTEIFWACQFAGLIPCVLTPLTQDHNQRVAHLTHLSKLLVPKVITTTHLAQDLSVVPELDVLELSTLTSLAPVDLPELVVAPDDISCLMLTSGSTGNAKAVELTHNNILSAVLGKRLYHKTNSQSVFLNWINFDHVACLTETHIHGMFSGGDQHHLPAASLLPKPLDFLRIIERVGVTYTFAPQFFLTALERALDGKKASFELPNNLRIISGGEACSTQICRKLAQHLFKLGAPSNVISPGFGMTETCAGSIYGLDFPRCDLGAVRENGSLGWCTSCQEMRVVDPETKLPVERNVQGELQVRGENVFHRYHNNPKATAECFTADGWFSTGDRAYICEDGLVLSGRDKDSLIVNGVKYFSSELEGMLEDAGIPGLASSWVAAFPVSIENGMEDFVILFKPTYHPRRDPALHFETVRAITDNCIRYSSHKAHGIIALPEDVFGAKSTLGKLSRPKLRKRYEAGEFKEYDEIQTELLRSYRQSQRVAPEGRYEQVVVETIAEVFGISTMDLGRNDNFFELGGSSLELLRFKGLVSQRLGTRQDVPLASIFNAPTVREIAQLFKEADGADHKYQPIVPLQSPKNSNKPPLFLLHPGVGEVLVFIKLANYIKDRPVFALRASGFQPGEEMFTSMEQMVEVYCQAIKEKQPQGPYYLAGYSYGGMLAFEMTQKLEAAGDSVCFLGMIDRNPHIKARMKSITWLADACTIAFLFGLTTYDQAGRLKIELHDKPKTEILNRIISNAPREKLEVFDLDEAKFERWVDIGYNLHQLARDYEPSGSIKATMHAFYVDQMPSVAKSREEWAVAMSLWKDFTTTPPILYSCPGNHYTMINDENVQAFQAIFQKALALAD